MRRRRKDWYPGGAAAALGAALLGLAGCPEPDKPPDPGPGTDMAAAAPAKGELSAAASTTGGAFTRPLDAVPTSDGTTFFFTAGAKDGSGMGVFKVPAAGGSATPVLQGAPLVAPFGIGISADDRKVYVADSTAGLDPAMPEGGAAGQVFAIPAGGGAAMPVTGTAGTRPRGLDVVSEGGSDFIYYAGTLDGVPAVLKIAASGGAPTPVLMGGMLVDPCGVAVSRARDVYVADTVGGGGRANILKIGGGTASLVLGDIQVGFPAGIALSRDEDWLVISGQDSNLGTAVVYLLDLRTRALTKFNKGIEASLDAGGLHRARGADVFAWAGVTTGVDGTVFRVTLK